MSLRVSLSVDWNQFEEWNEKLQGKQILLFVLKVVCRQSRNAINEIDFPDVSIKFVLKLTLIIFMLQILHVRSLSIIWHRMHATISSIFQLQFRPRSTNPLKDASLLYVARYKCRLKYQRSNSSLLGCCSLHFSFSKGRHQSQRNEKSKRNREN